MIIGLNELARFGRFHTEHWAVERRRSLQRALISSVGGSRVRGRLTEHTFEQLFILRIQRGQICSFFINTPSTSTFGVTDAGFVDYILLSLTHIQYRKCVCDGGINGNSIDM